MGHLESKRLFIVSGKGGVGRSVTAAALGLALSKQGKRTLLVELDGDNTQARIFGKGRSHYTPVAFRSNLYGVNYTPKEAQREYGLMKLKSRTAYKLVFENPLMLKMLNMVPGLRELLLLGKTWFTEQERTSDGTPLWDAIVIDGPATGHSISLFRLPRVILSLMKVGPMAKDAKAILDLLTDPVKTSFWIVTIPEELPVKECEELIQVNEEELHLPLDRIVMNQDWGWAGVQEWVEKEGRELGAVRGQPGVEETLSYLQERLHGQRGHKAKLQERFGEQMLCFPFLPVQPFTEFELEQLASIISGVFGPE